MAIDLLHSFRQKGSHSSVISDQSPAAQQENMQAQQMLRAVKSLQVGQTLQGEILSVKGDQVQLEVLKEVIIDARLSGALSLTPGMNMTFQVKANHGGTLNLTPLFTNIATDPNCLKALDMAGIGANERTVQMVQSMMEKGMNINRQALLDTYRDLVTFKESPVQDIVTLKMMNMAVSKDNLEQLLSYRNNEHLLGESFSVIGNTLANELGNLYGNQKIDQVNQLLHVLHEVFHGKQEGALLAHNLPEELLMDEHKFYAIEKENDQITIKLLNNEDSGVILLKENEKNEAINSLRGNEEEYLWSEGKKTEGMIKIPSTFEELAKQLLKDKHLGKFIADVERIWAREVRQQWNITPEKMMEKDAVKKLYEKIESQIKQLENVVDDHMNVQSPTAKMIHTVSSNVEFMHQLNQMQTYIQLPLSLTDHQTTGELYVFTNKKSLVEKEGRVTALLHLDMKYLGKMDVFVSLENNKVGTQFYLEKEEVLDFLDSHLDQLTARLNKRGYECRIKTSLRKEEEESIISKIENASKGQMVLSTKSFDMRA